MERNRTLLSLLNSPGAFSPNVTFSSSLRAALFNRLFGIEPPPPETGVRAPPRPFPCTRKTGEKARSGRLTCDATSQAAVGPIFTRPRPTRVVGRSSSTTLERSTLGVRSLCSSSLLLYSTPARSSSTITRNAEQHASVVKFRLARNTTQRRVHRQSFAPSNGIHVAAPPPIFSLRSSSRRVAQYLYARDICIHRSVTPPLVVGRPSARKGTSLLRGSLAVQRPAIHDAPRGVFVRQRYRIRKRFWLVSNSSHERNRLAERTKRQRSFFSFFFLFFFFFFCFEHSGGDGRRATPGRSDDPIPRSFVCTYRRHDLS